MRPSAQTCTASCWAHFPLSGFGSSVSKVTQLQCFAFTCTCNVVYWFTRSTQLYVCDRGGCFYCCFVFFITTDFTFGELHNPSAFCPESRFPPWRQELNCCRFVLEMMIQSPWTVSRQRQLWALMCVSPKNGIAFLPVSSSQRWTWYVFFIVLDFISRSAPL